jgi:hypothetical protein
MMAHVVACNHTLRTVTARTENDLSVVFHVVDDSELELGDVLDIPLPQVLVVGLIHRTNGGAGIGVRLRRDDIHDLRVTGGGHGVPSDVSDERMSAL